MELKSSWTIDHPWISTKSSCFFIPPTAKAALIPQNPDPVSSQPHCFPSLAIWLFDCIWLCGHTLLCACYGLHVGFRGERQVLVHHLLVPWLSKVSLVPAAAHGLVSGASPFSTAHLFFETLGLQVCYSRWIFIWVLRIQIPKSSCWYSKRSSHWSISPSHNSSWIM